MPRSYVVTGAAGGVGRAIAERLSRDGHVVALDLEPAEIRGITAIAGDAGDEEAAGRAADAAERVAPLAGWVNNAAVFRDARLHDASAAHVLDLIAANVRLAVTGCAVAVRRFMAAGGGGAIVNVSSHQAMRPVSGALPYATAKAAIEGLTRAVAVDYGPRGIRTNAVALGSIANARLDELLAERPEVAEQLRALHPLGRAGRAEEVATVVAHLLSEDAAFVNGAVVPIDGGRAVLGRDPEAR